MHELAEVADAATLLRVSPRRVEQLIRDGKLRARPPRRTMVGHCRCSGRCATECETGTEAAEKVFPVLLEELARSRYRYRRPVVVETEKSAREVLLEMFEPGPPRRSRRRGSAPVEIDPALVGDDFAEV